MSHLSAQQWEIVYEAALRILRAESLEEFAQESLGGFAALIPARQYMLFTFENYVPGRIQYDRAFTFGNTIHYLDTFLNGPYTEEDHIFSRMSMKVGNCAYRDSDIIDEETLVNLPIYKDIYERDGVHHGMRINMMVNNKLAGSYSIFKAKGESDFSDTELEIGNVLAPLFALRFKQLLDQESSGKKAIEKGLGRLEAMDRYGLTQREYQVVEKVARGFSDDEVAEALSVSSSTVRKHLYNAYAKMAVNRRSQLEALFGLR